MKIIIIFAELRVLQKHWRPKVYLTGEVRGAEVHIRKNRNKTLKQPETVVASLANFFQHANKYANEAETRLKRD